MGVLVTVYVFFLSIYTYILLYNMPNFHASLFETYLLKRMKAEILNSLGDGQKSISLLETLALLNIHRSEPNIH